MPSDIEQYLEHPIAQVTPAELVELRDMFNTIQDGQGKWADYLALKDKKAKPEPETGNLDQTFTAGAQGSHTPAGSSFDETQDTPEAGSARIPTDEMTPAELMRAIEQERDALVVRPGGRLLWNDLLKTFKVKQITQLRPDLREAFLQQMRESAKDLQ